MSSGPRSSNISLHSILPLLSSHVTMLRSPQHVASHIHLKYSRSFSSVRSPPSVLARQRDQSKLNAFETTAAVSHSRWMCVAGPSRIPIIRNRGQAAMFHSTPRQQSPQFLAALLAGVLKARLIGLRSPIVKLIVDSDVGVYRICQDGCSNRPHFRADCHDKKPYDKEIPQACYQ